MEPLKLTLEEWEQQKIDEIKELYDFLGKKTICYDLYKWLEGYIKSYKPVLNTVKITAKCGQETEMELCGIDTNQEIDNVVIRGVKYVKES